MASPQHPTTPVVATATEAQTRFGALLRRVCREGQHVIVERAGLPVVAILPLRDYEALVAAGTGTAATPGTPPRDPVGSATGP